MSVFWNQTIFIWISVLLKPRRWEKDQQRKKLLSTPCGVPLVTCVTAHILGTLWYYFASWTLTDALCKLNVKSLHSTFTAELGIFHRVFSATLVTEFWQLLSCTAFSLTIRTKLSSGLVCSPSWGDWCVVNCRRRAVTVDTKIIKQRRAWVSHCNMSSNEMSIYKSVSEIWEKNTEFQHIKLLKQVFYLFTAPKNIAQLPST